MATQFQQRPEVRALDKEFADLKKSLEEKGLTGPQLKSVASLLKGLFQVAINAFCSSSKGCTNACEAGCQQACLNGKQKGA
jgi:hypothetical protein